MVQLYDHFTAVELRCRCGCGLGQHNMSPKFMADVETLRVACGFPFPVNSAVRCSDYNRRVSTTGTDGPHVPKPTGNGMEGLALDIRITGERAFYLVEMIFALDLNITGIGEHLKGPWGGRFVHIDALPKGWQYKRPMKWTY